jgi:hypothetical protein
MEGATNKAGSYTVLKEYYHMNRKNTNRKAVNVDSVIALEAGFGIPFGLLFLDGNTTMGIFVASIYDAKKN